jgi:AcrR family transcriptional regulator
MLRLTQAFLDYGYEQLTMVGLAKACDFTRRALYHHFANKEDAFRGVIRWGHGRQIQAGMDAGQRVLEEGGGLLDAFIEIMDTRYGQARRDLERSPHAVEINYQAFRRCRDIMSESALIFQQRLETLIDELGAMGRLRLKHDVTSALLAQTLADGARGVNQSLPALPADGLPQRYRPMFSAILYGAAEEPKS